MTMHNNAINDIRDAASNESEQYATTISVLKGLACDNAISWDEVERIKVALQPACAKADAIYRAADHALRYSASIGRPQTPFMRGVDPVTDEEWVLLEQAWNNYFNI